MIIDGHNHYPNDVESTVADCHRVLVSGRGAAFTVTPIAGAPCDQGCAGAFYL